MEGIKKTLVTPVSASLSSYSIALGIVALAFLAGITGGCFLSERGGPAADAAVLEHLSPMAGSAMPRPDLVRVVINTLAYPALCFVLGYSIPGVALIPAVVCVKGFFVSYAVASCVKVFGTFGGVVFSLSLVGLPLLISLPCLFWLGTHGLLGSMGLLSSLQKKPFTHIRAKESFLRLGIAVCALAVAAAVDIYISPMLASLVAAKL